MDSTPSAVPRGFILYGIEVSALDGLVAFWASCALQQALWGWHSKEHHSYVGYGQQLNWGV